MATTRPAAPPPPNPDTRGTGHVPAPRTLRKRRGPSVEQKPSPLVGLAAWAVGLFFAAPVFWMVLTSLHSETDAATNPPSIAAELTLDGYRAFFGAESGQSPWPFLINSATASVVSTILVILLALPAAYALSIKPVKKWTDVLFFLLSTKMLPIVAGLLPLYLVALNLGVLDQIGVLIILYTSMNLPIAVWMMRSFLAEVPVEMLEAASLDGAGLVTLLRRVVAPVAMPGIAATALICFIFSWNELLLARTLTGVVAGTAPVFLTGFVTSQGLFLAQVCAAATAISLPVLAAGFAAQDKLVQGLSMGAVK
jgi:sorbitol/mannitol transport system permease protein